MLFDNDSPLVLLGEPGMLVGHISDSDPSREYHGYVDKSSSEKKILRDVYERGDKWFMTGSYFSLCSSLPTTRLRNHRFTSRRLCLSLQVTSW